MIKWDCPYCEVKVVGADLSESLLDRRPQMEPYASSNRIDKRIKRQGELPSSYKALLISIAPPCEMDTSLIGILDSLPIVGIEDRLESYRQRS